MNPNERALIHLLEEVHQHTLGNGIGMDRFQQAGHSLAVRKRALRDGLVQKIAGGAYWSLTAAGQRIRLAGIRS